MKEYSKASEILTNLIDSISAYRAKYENERLETAVQFEKTKEKYDVISKKVEKLLFTSQSSYVLQQIDTLRTFQKEYYKVIEKYYEYKKMMILNGNCWVITILA